MPAKHTHGSSDQTARREIGPLRLLFEHVPGIIWATDRNLRFTYIDGKLLQRGRAEVRGMLGASIHGLFGTSDRTHPLVRLHVAALAGEHPSARFDHNGRWYKVFVEPSFDANGKISGTIGTAIDITEQRDLLRRANFLSDASRLLSSLDAERALSAVAELAVPYLGDACAIDRLNNSVRRRVFSIQANPDFPVRLDDSYSMKTGHVRTYTLDGVAHLVAPICVKDTIVAVFVFAALARRQYRPADLQTADQLVQRASLAMENATLYETAQTALRVRDEFLAIAAHEIRGPLTGIHLAVEVLQKSTTDNAKNRALAIITREDRRLSRFVDELLELARVRTGHLDFVFEPVNVAGVVRDVLSRFSSQMDRIRSTVSLELDASVVGDLDHARLDQVITNLLANAMKFGLGKPIRIAVRALGGHALIVVEDHGLGIAKDVRERIFEPFERGVSVRNYGGLGLGLYIVRTIVERLEGTIRVDSEVDRGTTFTIELPLKRRP